MGKWTDEAKRVKPYLMKGAQTLPDTEALEVKGIYPTWEELVELGSVDTNEEPGYKFTYSDELHSCVNGDPTFQADWIPGTVPALYVRIDDTHAGTLDDPIPYAGNMELVEGLYYSENGVVYLCIRSTGQPVYHALADLVGLYVEIT